MRLDMMRTCIKLNCHLGTVENLLSVSNFSFHVSKKIGSQLSRFLINFSKNVSGVDLISRSLILRWTRNGENERKGDINNTARRDREKDFISLVNFSWRVLKVGSHLGVIANPLCVWTTARILYHQYI